MAIKKQPKPKRISNQKLMELALDKVRELGYTLYDVKLGNAYFLFTYEKNTICHFKIKELPGFKFRNMELKECEQRILWVRL